MPRKLKVYVTSIGFFDLAIAIGNLVHASEVPPAAPAADKAKTPERENLSLF